MRNGGKSTSGKGKSFTFWLAAKLVTCVETASTRGAWWSATAVEAMTSLEIADPTKETSHVERATRKAKARTNARIQSKRQWEQADPSCTTGSAMPAMFGTLDVKSMHGGTKRASD